jgi:hypothetical protein
LVTPNPLFVYCEYINNYKRAIKEAMIMSNQFGSKFNPSCKTESQNKFDCNKYKNSSLGYQLGSNSSDFTQGYAQGAMAAGKDPFTNNSNVSQYDCMKYAASSLKYQLGGVSDEYAHGYYVGSMKK